MKTKSILLLGIVSVLFLISTGCTVQKRRYRKGYYVSWNKNYSKNNTSNTKEFKTVKTKPKTNKKVKVITENTAKTAIIKKEVIPEINKKTNSLIKKQTEPLLKTKKETVFNYNISQTEIVTDSTQTVTKNEEPKQERIKNEKLSNAIILAFLSGWLFPFGGFIGIVVAYFFTITALKQIRENPEKYFEKEKTKALIIIIGFNVFFFAILIGSAIILINESLIFILFIFGLIYSIIGLIGLLILRNHKKRLAKRNNEHTANEE